MGTGNFQGQGRRRGYTLLTVMALLLICITIGFAVTQMSGGANRLSHQRLLNAQALQLAIGGLDEAAAAIKLDRGYAGFGARTLGNGTVSATVTAPAADRRVVEAVGTAANHTLRSTRRVRGTFLLPAAAPVFLNAIAAKRDLVLNGNVWTDSSPSLSEGNVHSNGNLTLHGSSVLVDGRATAAGVVYTTGSPDVRRGIESRVPPITFPEVDMTLRDAAIARGVLSGRQNLTDGRTLTGLVTGDLTIGTPNGVRLDGVVWVSGDVTISGPVTGTGTIIAEGELDLDARETYAAADVSQLAFITLSTATGGQPAVRLKGNREFKGIVYAPNGEIKVSGTPFLYGNLVANEITLSGNTHIRRWEKGASAPPPLPTYFVVGGWEEF
jgi:cytoskeletal protein CcmA (bactofilin family)